MAVHQPKAVRYIQRADKSASTCATAQIDSREGQHGGGRHGQQDIRTGDAENMPQLNQNGWRVHAYAHNAIGRIQSLWKSLSDAYKGCGDLKKVENAIKRKRTEMVQGVRW